MNDVSVIKVSPCDCLSRYLRLDQLRCGSSPQVFLREAARQRLQALLHREVLRLIVTLQRRFRALLERKHFVRMREAAVRIQVRDKHFSQASGFLCQSLHLVRKVGFLL